MKNLSENIALALRAIRSNILRAILTMLIIAFGIMALLGMLTALSSMQESLTSNFAEMGSNTFQIIQSGMDVRYSNTRKLNIKKISALDAERFIDKYTFPATVSVHFQATGSAVVRSTSIKTPPQTDVMGATQGYLLTHGLTLEDGRNFSPMEDQHGKNVAIIGHTLKEQLFGKFSPFGKRVTIGNTKYTIIGYLKKKGSSMGFSSDNLVIVPLKSAKRNFTGNSSSYTIEVQVPDVENLEPAINEAIATFRVIRKLNVREPNNFEIVKSDRLAKMVVENLSMIRVATFIIGFITLLGAAIGLMNIMLVSVKERTKEIGTRMAIGASPKIIRSQFLTEAVLISQIGGIAGIIAGIIIGNVVAGYIDAAYVIPWGWALTGFLICVAVGVSAGYYPAKKAAALDPIEALRYE